MAAGMMLDPAVKDVASGLILNREEFLDLVTSSDGSGFGFEVYHRLPRPRADVLGVALLVRATPSVQIIVRAASNFLKEARHAGA